LEIRPITSVKTAAAIESVRISGKADIHNIAKIDVVDAGSLVEVRAVFLGDHAMSKEIFPVYSVPLRNGNRLEVVRQSDRTLFTDQVH
jgi:hypothetical protein